MDPRDFNRLAGDLFVGRQRRTTLEAACLRAAISRAYYSAYLVVFAFFEQLGFPPAKDGMGHAQALTLLRRSGDTPLEEAGGMLADLATRRRNADYDMKRADVEKPNKAQATIEAAEDIIKTVDGIASDETRKAKIASVIAPNYQAIRNNLLK